MWTESRPRGDASPGPGILFYLHLLPCEVGFPPGGSRRLLRSVETRSGLTVTKSKNVSCFTLAFIYGLGFTGLTRFPLNYPSPASKSLPYLRAEGLPLLSR